MRKSEQSICWHFNTCLQFSSVWASPILCVCSQSCPVARRHAVIQVRQCTAVCLIALFQELRWRSAQLILQMPTMLDVGLVWTERSSTCAVQVVLQPESCVLQKRQYLADCSVHVLS